MSCQTLVYKEKDLLCVRKFDQIVDQYSTLLIDDLGMNEIN